MSLENLKKFPFFFLFVPIFFVLHGVTEYLFFLPIGSALKLLAIYLLCTFVLFFFFKYCFRDFVKSAIATVLVTLVYFFFGYFHDWLKKTTPNSFITKYSILLPVILFICGVCFRYIKRKAQFNRLESYFSWLFIIVIAIDFGTIAYKLSAKSEDNNYSVVCETCNKPDIYLIILDEYAGEDQLGKDFSFGNSAFLDSLNSLGFFVSRHSKSDYDMTPFSMASLLNLEMLPLNNPSYNDSTLNYCYERIYGNRVTNILSSHGYNILNYSIFDLKNYPSPCKNTLLVSGVELIKSQTLLSRFERDVWRNIVRQHFKIQPFTRNLYLKT